jgi:hypothetical protein
VIEKTGGEESYENLEELLEVVIADQTINDSGKQQWHEYKHRPLRNTKFGKEEWHV